jgi:hypothetical protein
LQDEGADDAADVHRQLSKQTREPLIRELQFHFGDHAIDVSEDDEHPQVAPTSNVEREVDLAGMRLHPSASGMHRVADFQQFHDELQKFVHARIVQMVERLFGKLAKPLDELEASCGAFERALARHVQTLRVLKRRPDWQRP